MNRSSEVGRTSEPSVIAAGTEPRSGPAAIYQDRPAPVPPIGGASRSPNPASPAASPPRRASLPRRSFLRRLRGPRSTALALAALAVQALAVPEQAEAQTDTTFISNSAQVGANGSELIRATAFTTGGNSGGYGLSSVDVYAPLQGGSPTPLVEIYEDNAGSPGTLFATLGSPATITNGANTFTATNTTLNATTTYWVVTSNSAPTSASTQGRGFRVRTTNSTTVDTGAAMGWSMGNGRYKSAIREATWTSSSNRIIFTIKGTLGTAPVTNNPPTVANVIPNQTAQVGTALNYAFPANTFADTDTSDTLTYTATQSDDSALPSWLSFAAATRTFSGTPQAADVGTVSVKVTASDGTDSVSNTFDIVVSANNPPMFATDTASRSFTELEGFFLGDGVDVGAVVTATDADDDPLTYSLEGTDAAKFSIDSSGQIRTVVGLNYDREAKASYSVTVKADDSNGGSDTIAVTITVDNAVEKPLAPAMPTVTATSGSTTSLDVIWTAPNNAGRPAITGYKVQYRAGVSGSWINHPHTGTGTTATIGSLTAATSYQVQVLAVNSDGDGPFSSPGAGTTGTPTNAAPEFATATASRSFTETVGDAAVSTAGNVGAVVTATDTDTGDTLTYSLEGTDGAKFGIVSGSGQIQTKVGEKYDQEAQASYSVTVKADDGNGGTDTIAVTINVDNAEEKPVAPEMPTVTATSGSTTSLDVSWTAPANTGRPAITGYKVEYRAGVSGSWINHPHTGTGTTATIAGLTAATSYQVQVLAVNSDGDGPFSSPGAGTTGTPANNAPVFADATAARSFTETVGDAAVSTAGNVGAVVTATDTDAGDTLAYSLEGTDAAKFGIVSGSGQIQTKVGEKYDREAQASYSVTVKADDGNGGSDTIAVTITVDNAEEKPVAPTMPTVTATSGSTTSLDVSWAAPANTGRPAITGYKVEYRAGMSGNWTSHAHTGTATTATIAGLTAATSYQVQVLAVNSDGDGPFSGPGAGTTNTAGNANPTFTDGASTTRAFTETVGDAAVSTAGNVGAVVTATDTDTGDTLAYSLEGTDAAKFGIVSSSGQIQTKVGEKYDRETKASYSVAVKAVDGNGGSATIAVTISVDDAEEKPVAPAMPAVAATSGSTTSLDVSWAAPANTGRPAITGYKVEYRPGSSGNWTNHAHSGTGTTATIASLTAATSYQVHVLAVNADGDGPFSGPGSGTTGTGTDTAPKVTNVDVTSMPDRATSYGTGEMIQFTVTFDQAVTVTGTPEFEFCLGSSGAGSCSQGMPPPTRRRAALSSGSGTTALVFSYTVVADDIDDNGIWAGNQDRTIKLDTGDAIVGTVSGLPAVLTHPEVGAKPRHKVNVAVPTLACNSDPNADNMLALVETSRHDMRPCAVSDDGQIRAIWLSEGSTLLVEKAVEGNGEPSLGNSPELEFTRKVVRSTRHDLHRFSCETLSGFGRVWHTSDAADHRISVDCGQAPPPPPPSDPLEQVTGVGVAPGNGQLVVTWTAVANATGYKVQWKSGGQGYDTGDRQATVTSGSTTSHTISGLTNGTEYTVRVIATRTGAADGPPAAAMTGTPAAPTTPGVTVSKSALTVAEEDTTGDSYTVVLDIQPTANVLVTVAGHAGTDVTPTPDALTFTTTSWDTARTVTVTAGNDADTADDSVSLTHGAESADSGYEGIPIAGVAVTVNDNDTARVMGVGVAPGDAQLVVTWTAVANATGYKVQWRSGSQGYDTGDRQAMVTSGSTTSHTIDSLANGTEYTVRVIATRTGANDGLPSDERTGTPTGTTPPPPPPPPPPPSGPLEQVTGVTVAPGNSQVVVRWTAVDNATGYKVQWKSGGQDYNTGDRQATVTSGSTTSHTISGLANGTEYTVQVIATRTGADDGPPAAEVTGMPVVPTTPGVTVSKSALTVPEEDPTGDSYTVVLDIQPTANVRVTVAGHAGTDVTPTPGALTFTTMDWETARTVTVTAGNDADTADESVLLTHGATSADSGYEGIPIAGVAVTVNDNDTARVMGVGVAPGDAQLVVTWTAVANATGYKVQWRSGGQGYDTGDRQATVTPGSTTSHTISGLANGTEYTVRVIATRTGANDGPPSAERTGTPTAEPVPVPALPMAGAIALGLLLLGTGSRRLGGPRCAAPAGAVR